MNYLAILDKVMDETQAEERTGCSWQDFYPDLDPADFEICSKLMPRDQDVRAALDTITTRRAEGATADH